MTWKEFKEEVERQGIEDDEEIDCIDVVQFSTLTVHKSYKKDDEGNEYLDYLCIN